MKILITGGNGYVAKSLTAALRNNHEVYTITRKQLNLIDSKAVNTWFEDKHFDVVIHCAVVGGSRLKLEDSSIIDQNLQMYYNLLTHKNKYNKFINFGSGAELFTEHTPYSLSKSIIRESIIEKENFYNIRIFGVFDENEWETRFIKTSIKKYINNEPMEIHQNKYMDFFYMEDLVNDNLPKEIDCTYCESKTLYHITDIINHLNNHQVEIKLNNSGIGIKYIGKFTDLGINYIGLEQGIIETYNKLKNEH